MLWLIACLKPTPIQPLVELDPVVEVTEIVVVEVQEPSTLYARVEVDPEDGEAWLALARLHLRAGDVELAELCAARAEALSIHDADLDNDRGVVALEQGHPDRALRAFRAALRVEPEHLDANLNVGGMAVRAADYEEARSRFETALRLDPTHEEALIGLGTSLAGLGEVDAALAVVEGYLAVARAPEEDAFALKDSLLQTRSDREQAVLARRAAERQAVEDAAFLLQYLEGLAGCDEMVLSHFQSVLDSGDPGQLRGTVADLPEDPEELRANLCP